MSPGSAGSAEPDAHENRPLPGDLTPCLQGRNLSQVSATGQTGQADNPPGIDLLRRAFPTVRTTRFGPQGRGELVRPETG